MGLISAGEIDWTNGRIQADLLQRLNRDNFKAAVHADVVGHAGELDREWSTSVHTRVASALLLESLPMTESSGLTNQDLTLAVLRPSDAGPEPVEALDRLMAVCWHTYPMPGGRGAAETSRPAHARRAPVPAGGEPGSTTARRRGRRACGGGWRRTRWTRAAALTGQVGRP